ncbi:hypothetical protein CERZMDRAFT_113789 [Cercospora zeae-maydis SCOH1-5]|uniref:Heterokaryon incompatibility domain-containing protein n=1 Tax=Cercospora zeae-maydis SCOH1-5 TaxID=717836 RepID=A0A6A6F8U0_9PEZI|nr:hypothetical protein CERZMDRAFT_113789 [Cercospora zeae-maydis SCOH1-5]
MTSLPHAILSHMWVNGYEVLFEDLKAGTSGQRAARQIQTSGTAQMQILNNFVWLDTRWIDDSSSAELSGAINSMYRRYRRVAFCSPFLLEVLLAPREVIFYHASYTQLGTRTSLSDILAAVTRIHVDFLLGRRDVRSVSIAQHLSWALTRVTTRPEDISYSLLGLLGVNMPLLYCEGHDAFTRLQHKIITDTNDESIFTWLSSESDHGGMLAHSPSELHRCNNVEKV